MPTIHLQAAGLQADLRDDRLHIRDEAGAEITALGRTAAMIFSLCDGLHTADAMTAVLAEIYPDDPPDLLAKDVRDCLEELARLGLVQARTINPP